MQVGSISPTIKSCTSTCISRCFFMQMSKLMLIYKFPSQYGVATFKQHSFTMQSKVTFTLKRNEMDNYSLWKRPPSYWRFVYPKCFLNKSLNANWKIIVHSRV